MGKEKCFWENEATDLWKQGLSWNEIANKINLKSDYELTPEKVRKKVYTTNEYKSSVRKSGMKAVPFVGRDDFVSYKDLETSWKRDAKTGVESWGGIIEFPKDKMLTTEDVMKAWNLDPKEWECIAFDRTIYQANAGEGKAMNLYRCRLNVKPVTLKDMGVEAAKQAIRDAEIIRAPKGIGNKGFGNTLASIEIVDLHFGKLGWHGEVGENYDHHIAEERFWFVIDDFISHVKNTKIQLEKIIFPIGNDFFNSDTIDGTTTGGTPQDNDVRPHKMFSKGYSLIRAGILELASIAPVDVILVAGNHDQMTSYYMAFALDQYFSDCEYVTIDHSAKLRKYVEYGNTVIGYAHGDKDRKRLLECMLSEAREEIGRTKYMEMHTGHLHSEGVKEEAGLITRTVPSVTGKDAWHNASGYVGSVPRAQTFFYDKEEGLKYILYSTVS